MRLSLIWRCGSQLRLLVELYECKEPIRIEILVIVKVDLRYVR